jgi:hypothetical protein
VHITETWQKEKNLSYFFSELCSVALSNANLVLRKTFNLDNGGHIHIPGSVLIGS